MKKILIAIILNTLIISCRPKTEITINTLIEVLDKVSLSQSDSYFAEKDFKWIGNDKGFLGESSVRYQDIKTKTKNFYIVSVKNRKCLVNYVTPSLSEFNNITKSALEDSFKEVLTETIDNAVITKYRKGKFVFKATKLDEGNGLFYYLTIIDITTTKTVGAPFR